MAVTLSTDIVADVMRAATPERLQEARARLRSMAASAPGATQAAATFENRLPDQAAAMRKFDAMVLGTFVEAMLPDDMAAVYGDGLAGDMWKSMLAQHLGENLAAQGGVSIASRYFGDRYADGEKPSPLRGFVDADARAAIDGQNSLSRSLVEELQRKALDAVSGAAASGSK